MFLFCKEKRKLWIKIFYIKDNKTINGDYYFLQNFKNNKNLECILYKKDNNGTENENMLHKANLISIIYIFNM
jgi:hypothetical protein